MFKDFKTNIKFRCFVLGNWLSFCGQSFASIAIPIIVYNLTKNINVTAWLIALQFIPNIFTNQIVHWINKKNYSSILILYIVNIGQIILYLSLLFTPSILHYCIFTLLSSLCSSLDYVYRNAALKDFEDTIQLTSANNLLAVTRNIINFLSPIIGAFIYSILNDKIIIFIACFFFTMCLYFYNKSKLTKGTKNIQLEDEHKPKHSLSTIKSIIQKYPIITLLFVVDAIASISFGSLNTIMPIIVQTQYENNANILSLFKSLLYIGIIIGGIIFEKKLKQRDKIHLYVASTVLASLGFILLIFMQSYISYALTLGVIGLFNIIQDNSLSLEIQLKTSNNNETSILFSLYQTLISVAFIITTVPIPHIISTLGYPFIYICFGLLSEVALVLFFIKYKKKKKLQ